MTHVAWLELDNWMHYKGHHRQDLGLGVHAVVAERVNNPDSSNWGGKTSFLLAIRFALFGDHTARVEDDWIYEGEKFGMVSIGLDSGQRIERSRKLGKSTTLLLTEGGVDKRGDEAQKRIDEIVGLKLEDFDVSCFIGQKQMSKFVTMLPSERMRIVGEWFDLDKILQCEDAVSKRLIALVEKDVQFAQRQAVVGELVKAASSKVGPDPWSSNMEEAIGPADLFDPDTYLAELEAEAVEGKKAAKEAQAQVEALAGWQRAAKDAQRYKEICEKGIELKTVVQANDPVKLDLEVQRLSGASATAEARLRDAKQKQAEALKLAAGEFDGLCPVMRQACPVKAKVVELTTSNRAMVKAAKDEVGRIGLESNDLLSKCGATKSERDRAAKLAAQLEGLRGQASELLPSVAIISEKGEPPDGSEERQKADVAWGKANAAVVRHEEAKRAIADIRKHEDELTKLGESRANLSREIATHREALVVFGRNGAQRRIAEGALSEIEQGANELLEKCEIDLSFKVRWSRESAGKGELALTCGECGEPFPRGRAAKECSRCGAKRQAKTVDKLELEMSDRSGAADDLVGITFYLSGAAWLREERGSSWGAAFIDEPFGSLDANNRRALAGKLVTMLEGRYGFEQAFVVSHSPDVNDALPGRIEIVADDERSWFKGESR